MKSSYAFVPSAAPDSASSNLRLKTLLRIGALKPTGKQLTTVSTVSTVSTIPPTFEFPSVEYMKENTSKKMLPNDRLLRSNTNVAALYFLTCALAFFATGILCVYTSNHQYGTSCVGIERGQFNVVAQITIGKQQRRIKLLVRSDMVIDCDLKPAVVITKQDVVTSSDSATCDSSSTCIDIVTIRSHQKNKMKLLKYKLGVSHLHDLISYSAGLDGELYMCLGSRYAFDERQMCWDDALQVGTGGIPLDHFRESLELKLVGQETNGKYNFVTSTCALKQLKSVKTPSFCEPETPNTSDTLDTLQTEGGEHDVVGACDLKDESTTVDFLHPQTLDAKRSLGMTSTAIAQYSKSSEHMQYAYGGSLCSGEEGYGLYTSLCVANIALSSDYGCNFQRRIYPSMNLARVNILFDFRKSERANPLATVSFSYNIALDVQSIPGDLNVENDWTTMTWPTIRLLIMVLAAAVVYIRQEDSMEKNDRLFVNCIRMIVHEKNNHDHRDHSNDQSLERTIQIEEQSRVLGLLAIVSRCVVLIALGNSLWKTGLPRVVVIQSIASCTSFIHWTLTHSHYATPVKQLALGGSSAIIDVSSAIILAYSTPPIRADVDTFNTIARLLTCALIVITCPTRCFFSSACAGIIYGPESWIIHVFWIIQAVSIAILVVDLFAIPASIDMMRSYSGTWDAAAFSIFGTLLSICGPRLTSNAIAISNASNTLHNTPEPSSDTEDSKNT